MSFPVWGSAIGPGDNRNPNPASGLRLLRVFYSGLRGLRKRGVAGLFLGALPLLAQLQPSLSDIVQLPASFSTGLSQMAASPGRRVFALYGQEPGQSGTDL